MLYDITPPITPDLAVFPGDSPPTREVLLDLARGDHVTLSTLRVTVHVGAVIFGVPYLLAWLLAAVIIFLAWSYPAQSRYVFPHAPSGLARERAATQPQ